MPSDWFTITTPMYEEEAAAQGTWYMSAAIEGVDPLSGVPTDWIAEPCDCSPICKKCIKKAKISISF